LYTYSVLYDLGRLIISNAWNSISRKKSCNWSGGKFETNSELALLWLVMGGNLFRSMHYVPVNTVFVETSSHVRLSGYYRVFHKLCPHLNKLWRTVKMYVKSVLVCGMSKSKFSVKFKKIETLTNVNITYDKGTFLELLAYVNHFGNKVLSF
jgi:hypothetical protein